MTISIYDNGKHEPKVIAAVSALALMAAPMTAFAADPMTGSTEQSGEVTISAEIAPDRQLKKSVFYSDKKGASVSLSGA